MGSATERPLVVSWDVDGTLYDLAAMKRHVARAALLRAWDPATWRAMRRLGRFRAEVEATRARGGAVGEAWRGERAACAALEERWYAPAIARAGLRGGVRALIDAVSRAGVRQVVVSDFAAEAKVASLGLGGAFTGLFAGEALGHLKPSARLFDAVAQQLGVAPGRIVHIGDREETDGAGARAAGWRFVMAGARIPGVAAVLGNGSV